MFLSKSYAETATLVIGSSQLAAAMQGILPPGATIYATGPTDDHSDIFARIKKSRKQLTLVIFQPPAAHSQPLTDLTGKDAERRFQSTAYPLFLAAQSAISAMLKKGSGSLIVLGSSLAESPQPNLALESAAYAGMRTLTQSLSREFHPQGIHIAYVALPHPLTASAADLAQLCLQLHEQPSSAWTQEVGM
jgi:short-subunit dehydrogenase